jgi:hypothetical protein
MITAASDKTGGPSRPPAALSVYGLRDRNRAAAVPAMMIALSSGRYPHQSPYELPHAAAAVSARALGRRPRSPCG